MQEVDMRILLVLFLLFGVVEAKGQETPMKIIFDVTSQDAAVHEATMRYVKLMSESYPDAKLEVVIYAQAINMALAENSSVKDQILSVQDDSRVSIVVCEGTMARNSVTKEMLLGPVRTVADGLRELAVKQQQGWSYIKPVAN